MIMSILWLSFYGLFRISEENKYTGVREFTKPKIDTTPPTIEFVNFKDGDIVVENTIYVEVSVNDDITPSESILVEWDGGYTLHSGFNSIVVSARDKAGNVASRYIIIEKK